MLHSIATHNGFLTLTNLATGQHRTFRIHTQPDDAKFAPGQRVVGLLTGPDNTSDYESFGFVKDNGKISVFLSKRGEYDPTTGRRLRSDFDIFADMLRFPANFEARGVVYQFSIKCRKCNRELTDSESIELGIGPTCRGKTV